MAKPNSEKRGQLSAQDWLLAAIEAMAHGGVDNVKVERLAKSLGVSKGSFYWHFKDRKDLLDQVIHYWVAEGTEQVMAANKQASAAVEERLVALFQLALEEPVGALSSAQGEMAIRSWAMIEPNIAKIVAASDTQRINYVAELFVALGHPKALATASAEHLYLMLLGYYARATYAPHTAKASQANILNVLQMMMSRTGAA